MSDMDFETQIRSLAVRMEYPRTPDISGFVTKRLRTSTRSRFISRRLAWSMTIIFVLLSSLLLIPSARAAIIDFIQVGVVRIFPRTVEPTAQAIRTAMPELMNPLTATPVPTQQSLLPILSRIAGKTTLDEAQKRVSYPILLPAYPVDLGKPDYVFVQNADGQMVVLVWLDPRQSDHIRMSLHFVPSGSWAVKKIEPKVIEETTVNNQRAIWTEGPYILRLINGNTDFTRLIDGHVLIWAEGDITYRLETDLALDEAVKIAESLRPIP